MRVKRDNLNLRAPEAEDNPMFNKRGKEEVAGSLSFVPRILRRQSSPCGTIVCE